MASTRDHIQMHGDTFYSQSNYDPNHYTLQNMLARDTFRIYQADLVRNIFLSKAKCLLDAGKPTHTTVFALEKDEEYYPTFKECVKTTVSDFLSFRD